MTDAPYPGPREPHITYSLREVIDQINSKLDLLPQLVSDQAVMKADANKLEARVLVVETKIEDYEHRDDMRTGGLIFKDKLWAKFLSLAGLMGVIAGLTVTLIQSL